MESQKTTHFLLTLVVFGVLVLIFMVARQNSLEKTYFQTLLWGEANPEVPATPLPPITQLPPVTPIPEPDPVPTPTLENLPLITGQLYVYGFTTDTAHNPKMKYCGIKPHTVPGQNSQYFMIFVPAGASCTATPMVSGTEGLSLNELILSPKAGVTYQTVEALTSQYGAKIKTVGQDSYVISVDQSGVNAYTLASTFFSTGNFSWAQAVSGFSIMSN